MARKTIDTKYVKLLQQGDSEAFEEIFRFYKDSIFYFALSFVKNRADAEEIVQDTFIQALRYINDLEKPSSFHSWIHKIAYNKSMTLYKQNSKHVQMDNDFDLENMIENKEGPENMLARSEIVSVIKSEIENMPEGLVQVAQLRYFDDFTTREIADIMDIPEGTVKTRLKKVRKIIQPKLSAKGFTPAKYFSFLFTPMVFEAFQQIIASNGISSESTSRLIGNMASVTSGLLASIAAGAAGMAGGAASASAGVSTTIETATKVAVAAVSGGAGLYGAYQIAQPLPAHIDSISYHESMTNENIEIEVALSNTESEDDIHIYLDNTELAFNLNENTLVFEATQNGDYIIQVGEEEHQFTVSNIDKTSPELATVEKQGSTLKITSSDDLAGIDYTKSYLMTSDGQKAMLNESGVLEGDYEGVVQIYLYDNVGNESVYSVDLDA